MSNDSVNVRVSCMFTCVKCWRLFSERTEKVSMGSIKAVVSEPIEKSEEYHMLASISCYYILHSAVRYPI